MAIPALALLAAAGIMGPDIIDDWVGVVDKFTDRSARKKMAANYADYSDAINAGNQDARLKLADFSPTESGQEERKKYQSKADEELFNVAKNRFNPAIYETASDLSDGLSAFAKTFNLKGDYADKFVNAYGKNIGDLKQLSKNAATIDHVNKYLPDGSKVNVTGDIDRDVETARLAGDALNKMGSVGVKKLKDFGTVLTNKNAFGGETFATAAQDPYLVAKAQADAAASAATQKAPSLSELTSRDKAIAGGVAKDMLIIGLNDAGFKTSDILKTAIGVDGTIDKAKVTTFALQQIAAEQDEVKRNAMRLRLADIIDTYTSALSYASKMPTSIPANAAGYSAWNAVVDMKKNGGATQADIDNAFKTEFVKK